MKVFAVFFIVLLAMVFFIAIQFALAMSRQLRIINQKKTQSCFDRIDHIQQTQKGKI
jgi:hypothetical protein